MNWADAIVYNKMIDVNPKPSASAPTAIHIGTSVDPAVDAIDQQEIFDTLAKYDATPEEVTAVAAALRGTPAINYWSAWIEQLFAHRERQASLLAQREVEVRRNNG